MTLGEKVRALREERGWSREKLAVEAKVSYSTIVRTELGRVPRFDAALRIANTLDVTLDYLGEGMPGLLAYAS